MLAESRYSVIPAFRDSGIPLAGFRDSVIPVFRWRQPAGGSTKIWAKYNFFHIFLFYSILFYIFAPKIID